jgi:hypothetical protein
MTAVARWVSGIAAIAAVCVVLPACEGANTFEPALANDDPTPASMSIQPATLVVQQGDTAVIHVTVRNAKGKPLTPGAPNYLLNWKASNLQILRVGQHGSRFTIYGTGGGDSEIEFLVVPFGTSSANSGSGFSSAVKQIRGSAKVKVVGRPASVVVVSGDYQGAAAGATLPDLITVQVRDNKDRGMADQPVEFAVESGGGSVAPASIQTDAEGYARTSWTLGNVMGEQILQVVAGNSGNVSVVAVAQPAATQVVRLAGDGQSGPASTPLADSVAVQVLNADNSPVQGVTVYWNVTSGGGQVSPDHGVTDASGVLRAAWTLGGTSGAHTLSAMAPGVGEVAFSATATTGVAAGVDRIEVSPATATLDAINEQTTLKATVYDAANQILSGETITWSSLSSDVATVDGSGHVTARAVGTALIVAMASGAADTAAVTVRQVPASVEVSPASLSLSVGSSEQLQATVRDAGGTTISSPDLSWRSSSTSIASVSSTGLVTALADGTSVITATSGSASSDAAVTVSGTSSPPQHGGVPLQIVGFKTGQVLVSSGIPLAPGMLKPGDIGHVRLMVGSQEQSIFVKALRGRHRDGSVRSVLVQFMYNVGTSPIAAELVIGSSRTTQDRQETQVSFTFDSPLPAAVVLPSSVDYLLRSGLVLPTVAMPSSFSYKYEDRFAEQSDGRWGVFKPKYDTNTVNTGITENYYDRALSHWAWWVRTGDAKYWMRAVHYLMAYRENYMRPNDYSVQPHNMMLEGLELHYLLTGDEESRYGVGAAAKMLTSPTGWLGIIDQSATGRWEGRIMSRILLGILTAHRLELETADARQTKNMRELAAEAVDRILNRQSTKGTYPDDATCGEQLNYMTGLINESFAKYYDLIEPDPRIPPAIAKSLDYMWNTQWKSADGGFAYLSAGFCDGVGSHDAGKPDLNMLIGHGFGWMYRVTKDATYRERGDVIFNEGVNRAWFGSSTYTTGDKQFNESYRSSWQYLINRM